MTKTWTDHLACTKHGVPRAIFRNAVTALREHPGMFGVLGFDEFAYRTMLLNSPPWEMPTNLDWSIRPWTSHDDLACCDWLQHEGISVSAKVTADAVELVAHDCTYHPVMDYLSTASGMESSAWKRSCRSISAPSSALTRER